jgi:hypothetical protein
MEYAYPPIYDIPGEDGGGDGGEIPGDPMCPGCWITATTFLGSLGYKNAQICFPYGGTICMTPAYDAMYSEWKKTGILPEEFGDEWPTLASFAAAWASGTFTWKVVTADPPTLEFVPEQERYYRGGYCLRPVGGNWPLGNNTTVRITFKDGYGNTCRDDETIYVDCCQDPTTPTFAFDDASTPDTIAKNSTISVYVTGGCAPYAWSVSGTGFSLGSASTSGVSNTLTASNNNCGASQAAIATVVVVDNCGVSKSGIIKFTGGQYVEKGDVGHTNLVGYVGSPPDHCSGYGPCNDLWDHYYNLDKEYKTATNWMRIVASGAGICEYTVPMNCNDSCRYYGEDGAVAWKVPVGDAADWDPPTETFCAFIEAYAPSEAGVCKSKVDPYPCNVACTAYWFPAANYYAVFKKWEC